MRLASSLSIHSSQPRKCSCSLYQAQQCQHMTDQHRRQQCHHIHLSQRTPLMTPTVHHHRSTPALLLACNRCCKRDHSSQMTRYGQSHRHTLTQAHRWSKQRHSLQHSHSQPSICQRSRRWSYHLSMCYHQSCRGRSPDCMLTLDCRWRPYSWVIQSSPTRQCSQYTQLQRSSTLCRKSRHTHTCIRCRGPRYLRTTRRHHSRYHRSRPCPHTRLASQRMTQSSRAHICTNSQHRVQPHHYKTPLRHNRYLLNRPCQHMRLANLW